MCGRTRCTLRVDDVPRACHVNNRPLRTLNTDRYRPMYNVSPGAYMPVVRRDDGCNSEGVAVHCMKWGLVPSFTKKSDKPDHFKMFNARSESIREKASFRRLIPKNRCLVAVEGFYEWKKDGSKKQPYYIHFKDGRPLVFAALYDSWESSEGETLYTFTIVTTSSSSSLQWLHDRMPVILGDEGATELWLNGAPSSKFETILKPYEESDLGWYPVTPAMGKTSFNGPECIKEIELKMEQKNQISKFFAKKEKMGNQKLGTEKEGSSDESFKGNMVTSLKEESANTDVSPLPSVLKERPEIKDVHQLPSVKKEENEEVCAPDISGREVAKCQVKREYDEFSADSKSTNIIDKASPTPKKKKGNVRNADDKQPTLLSYFGKS